MNILEKLFYYLAVWQPIQDMPRLASIITWGIFALFLINHFKKKTDLSHAISHGFFWLLFYLCSFDALYNLFNTFRFNYYGVSRILWQGLMWSCVALAYHLEKKHIRKTELVRFGYTAYIIFHVIIGYWQTSISLGEPFYMFPAYFSDWDLACRTIPISAWLGIVYGFNWIGRGIQLLTGIAMIRGIEK